MQYKVECCNEYSNVATLNKVLKVKHGISVRERCWHLLVCGFDDMRCSGELQKYHVFGCGVVACLNMVFLFG